MISNEYINRAIDYILSHINETVSVEELAAHCNFSKYHFSRMFKLETGESIHEFIKRVKLEQSAFRLKVEQRKRITEVGLDYGYSASNYSSAFKEHHELSPIEFRRTILQKSLKNPIFRNAVVGLKPFEACCQKISIEMLPDYPVIFERYKGNYGDLSHHWGAFQARYSDYITAESLFLERTFDDPSITGIDECLYDLYLTVPEDCPLRNTCVITGGKFAVYHFIGPVDQIYTAYQCLFQVWLPQSQCEIDDRYGFEIYRKINCDTMQMEIDLCLPIK